MRLAIYNQELSDHVESATRQQQAGSPSAALARKFANMPPPQSPRGNVLGALNPNSLRKYSSAKKGSAKRSGGQRNTCSRKNNLMTPRSSRKQAHEDDSPTSLLGPKRNARETVSKALPFHIAVDAPREVTSSSSSASSASASPPSKSSFSSSLQAISTTPSSRASASARSPPLAKNSSSSSLASAPRLKTPSPTTSSCAAAGDAGDAKPILGGARRAGRYSSPTDSFLSPISSALVPKGGKRVNARKAMAERAISTASLRSKSNGGDDEGLNLIVPIQQARAKYLRSSSTPVLPGLKSRLKAKLSSPTDALFSPVSSHFVKRSSDGRKLEKLNVQKAIFMKQNRK